MSPQFDADTALTGADGRWSAQVREHWFVQRGPNGGLVAALATRALTEVAGGEGRAPRSLTLHYLAPPVAGEIEVVAAVERAGRTTTFASLRVLQEGVTVAYGLGCCSAWREGQPEWDVLERPDVPGPGEIESLKPAEEFPFLSNYELRPLEAPHVGAWMRPAEPRAADPVLLAALTDAWVPAAFAHMEHPTFVPTIDLTIHWRAPLGAAPGEHPWVLGVFSTRLGAGGTWEEDGAAVERGRRPARPVAPARDRAQPTVIGHLGLGSNVGDRRAHLQAAVDALPGVGVRVLASSAVYDTEPVGEVLDQPEFLNAVVRVSTDLEPEALLDACKAVERELGRQAGGVRHGPRPIDVDVLLLGDVSYRVGAVAAAARRGDVAAVRDGAAARRDARRDAPRRVAGRGGAGGARPGPGGAARRSAAHAMIRGVHLRPAIALLALGLAAAGCGGDSGGDKKSTAKATPTSSPKAAPVSGKEPDEKVREHLMTINEVGKTESDGGIRFKVTSLGEVRRIPLTADALKRQYGFRLIRADVTYTNRTKRPVDLLCGGKGFELLDRAEHRHQPVQHTPDLVGNEEVCKRPVPPGGTSKLVLAYEFSDVYHVHGLEIFNSADKRDPKGVWSRLRFVNPKR